VSLGIHPEKPQIGNEQSSSASTLSFAVLHEIRALLPLSPEAPELPSLLHALFLGLCRKMQLSVLLEYTASCRESIAFIPGCVKWLKYVSLVVQLGPRGI